MCWHAYSTPQRLSLCGLVGMPSGGRPIDLNASEELALYGRRRR